MRLNQSLLLAISASTSFFVGVSAAMSSKAKAKVLLFLSTDCPVAAQYTPRLNYLFAKYGSQGVSFEALFPNDLESRPSIEAYMADRAYKFPFDLDLGASEAKKLGVKTVPTAVVLNPDGKEVYRGPIDDNPDSTLVRRRYLDEALAASLDGAAPPIKSATGLGCIIMPSAAPPSAGAVTYASLVEPILEKHCVQCHRPGEVAPFSLLGFENAHKWAPNIAKATDSRQMPPWKAIKGFGEFKHDNSLSETEIKTLSLWSDAGAPKGKLVHDDDKIGAAPEWTLGKPDLIVEPSTPYKLAADGSDVYRNYVIKTHFTTSQYVDAMDVKPGNRRIVHHVIVFVDTSGISNKLEARSKDGQPGFTSSGGGPGFFPDTSFGGWAPGTRAARAPEGTAFLLKPGANIVLQVHYHKDGKPEEDCTRVGLYFAKSTPQHVMDLDWLVNPMIHIPAGDAHHVEHLTFTTRKPITVYGVMPHMHLLGSSMRAEAIFPDGTKTPLIFVKDWDFNWQLTYAFKQPLKLPAGGKIVAEAVFDNSATNPKNPNNPPKDVWWGEQTTDEMFLLVVAKTDG